MLKLAQHYAENSEIIIENDGLNLGIWKPLLSFLGKRLVCALWVSLHKINANFVISREE